MVIPVSQLGNRLHNRSVMEQDFHPARELRNEKLVFKGTVLGIHPWVP